jgi:hypothetical protein
MLKRQFRFFCLIALHYNGVRSYSDQWHRWDSLAPIQGLPMDSVVPIRYMASNYKVVIN